MTTDLTPETATERVELAALLRDFDGGPAVITAPYFEYVDEHLRPAVERMIASRLADMTRQRDEAQRDLTKTQDAFHLAKKSRDFQKKKRDQAERELADLRARIEDRFGPLAEAWIKTLLIHHGNTDALNDLFADVRHVALSPTDPTKEGDQPDAPQEPPC